MLNVKVPLLASSSVSPALHHLSSVAASMPVPSRAIYSATKSAGLMAMESCRAECEGSGIRFFCELSLRTILGPLLMDVALLPGTIANDFRTKTATSATGGRDETKLGIKHSWDKLLLAPEIGKSNAGLGTSLDYRYISKFHGCVKAKARSCGYDPAPPSSSSLALPSHPLPAFLLDPEPVASSQSDLFPAFHVSPGSDVDERYTARVGVCRAGSKEEVWSAELIVTIDIKGDNTGCQCMAARGGCVYCSRVIVLITFQIHRSSHLHEQ